MSAKISLSLPAQTLELMYRCSQQLGLPRPETIKLAVETLAWIISAKAKGDRIQRVAMDGKVEELKFASLRETEKNRDEWYDEDIRSKPLF